MKEPCENCIVLAICVNKTPYRIMKSCQLISDYMTYDNAEAGSGDKYTHVSKALHKEFNFWRVLKGELSVDFETVKSRLNWLGGRSLGDR